VTDRWLHAYACRLRCLLLAGLVLTLLVLHLSESVAASDVSDLSTSPAGQSLSVRDVATGKVIYPVTDSVGSVTGTTDGNGVLSAVTQYGRLVAWTV